MNVARAVIAAVLAAALVACGSPTQPAPQRPVSAVSRVIHSAPPRTGLSSRQTPKAPVRPPIPGNISSADPDSVARAVVITANQSDTETDSSFLDALRRAGHWLTPALLAGSLAVPERADAGWAALLAHHGYTTVGHIELANEYGQPPNTATTHFVQISYLVLDLGRDGWSGHTPGPQLARLQLMNVSGLWQVEAFD